ncbi:MAG: ABC transporter permease [Verrucomicrobiae bacterium]|nr:ABC transporter permease [Verrucomicrobiae bacterium]
MRSSSALSETVVSADVRVRFLQYLRDLWHYRDLFRALIERDVKVRYKQTALGVMWVILQPLFMAGAFSLIFGRVVQMPSAGLPYSIFYLAALIPWTCFSNGLSQAAGSMEGSAGLISKVYFPRLIVPSAMVLGTVVDFAIGWLLFNGLAIYRGFWTWWFIPFTPVLLVLQLFAAMGIGLVLAALNAQYRDVRYVTPFLLQAGMLCTPVIYPLERLLSTRFTEQLGVLIYLNPMAGVIETYRALCFSASYVPWKLLAGNSVTTAALLAFGIWFFRRREQAIVDLL